MSDWVHCNKCFLRYHPSIKFYITTCGHLKCQTCVLRAGTENHCLVCKSSCNMVVLSDDLKSDIQCFFRPSSELVDKAKQVCAFQFSNATSLLKNITAKYTVAKGEILKNYKVVQALKRENMKLRMLLKSAAQGQFGAGMAPSGLLIGNVMSPISNFANMTPVSNISNSSVQTGNPNARFMPRNMARTSHQQYSGTSRLNLSYARSQEFSPGRALFAGSGTPNVSSHGVSSAQNAAMMSMSRLQPGLGNKPR